MQEQIEGLNQVFGGKIYHLAQSSDLLLGLLPLKIVAQIFEADRLHLRIFIKQHVAQFKFPFAPAHSLLYHAAHFRGDRARKHN